jgi:hypothetical protein
MTEHGDELKMTRWAEVKNAYNNVKEGFTFNIEGYILDYNGCGYNFII